MLAFWLGCQVRETCGDKGRNAVHVAAEKVLAIFVALTLVKRLSYILM